MSSVAQAPQRPAPDDPVAAATGSAWSPRPTRELLVGAGLAAAFVALAFTVGGGVDTSGATAGNTYTNIVLTLVGAAAVVAALLADRDQRQWGAGALTWMAALTALTAASIAWSVQPDASWLGSAQALAYLAVFAGSVALARSCPLRADAIVGAITCAAAAVCAWSLLAKVFPASLAADNTFGRLQAPYGYWNAIGLMGAIGLPGCLWLGARRERGRWLAGLTAPAAALMVAVLVLSFSRSADLAAAVAVGLWLAIVPLRLRAVALLAVGAAGGAAISVWALTHRAVSDDNVAIAAQSRGGHTFGIVALAVIVVVTGAGVAVARRSDTIAVAPALRRRIGLLLLGLLALVPVAAVVGLALSSRGLTGEVSHGYDQLTSNSLASTNTAGRVLQVGSSRPTYWHEALSVGDHRPLSGAGELGFAIARLRYAQDSTFVNQAHSFVFQTYADLGIPGLLLVALLLAAWLIAGARTLAVWRGRASLDGSQAAERSALATLMVSVVAFGVQSTLDWTWFFAAVAAPVLVCAGWIAGRGPVTEPAGGRPRPWRSLLDRPLAATTLPAVIAIALLGAWLQWQPQRSADDVNRALNASSTAGALSAARSAVRADPLSLEPRQLLFTLYNAQHRKADARRELVRATRVQPDNPTTWLQLGQFDVVEHHPGLALASLRRVRELDITHDSVAGTGETLHRQALAALAAGGR